jgi:hypothetical protein
MFALLLLLGVAVPIRNYRQWRRLEANPHLKDQLNIIAGHGQ